MTACRGWQCSQRIGEANEECEKWMAANSSLMSYVCAAVVTSYPLISNPVLIFPKFSLKIFRHNLMGLIIHLCMLIQEMYRNFFQNYMFPVLATMEEQYPEG